MLPAGIQVPWKLLGAAAFIWGTLWLAKREDEESERRADEAFHQGRIIDGVKETAKLESRKEVRKHALIFHTIPDSFQSVTEK